VDGPPLPQIKYNMADGRHIENRYDVIFPQRMFRFGRNFADGCRMIRRLLEMVDLKIWRTFVFQNRK